MASFDCLIAEPQVVIALAENLSFLCLIIPPDTDSLAPTVAITPLVPGPVSKDQVVVVLVEDFSNTISNVIIMATWLDVSDVVWDGDEFAPAYSQSSRSATAAGWQFNLKKNLGWPVPLPEGEQLRIRVVAYDETGNEAV